jgi:hypothetical protein
MGRGVDFARTALAITACAAALCACASLPPPPPPRQAKTPEAYETARSFAAPTGEWPVDAWWKAYGDPQLDSLIDQALAGSPDLAEAAARVRAARALTAQAVSAGLPKVSAFGTVQEVKATLPPILNGYNDTGVLSLNFNWDLDFFGGHLPRPGGDGRRGRGAADPDHIGGGGLCRTGQTVRSARCSRAGLGHP